MKRPLFAAGLMLAVITAVWMWMGGRKSSPGLSGTDWPVSRETVVMTGQVCRKDESSFSVKSNILYSIDQEAAISQHEISLQEKIICETTEAETVYLGATVTVKGIFEPFSEASNPGEFDSSAYYRSINTCGKLRKTEILSQEPPSFWGREKLYQLRCRWKDRLYDIFPEREAAVMSALLLGDRTELDRDLKDLYQRNGILHILSISSLHITILGMGVYRLLRRFGIPAWAAALTGGILMGAYGIMTGFGVSACRAIIMYFLRMLAEVTGRTYDMLSALGTAGLGMLVYCPNYLENSGFLLSFSSILGIGIVYPALVRLCTGKMTPVLYGESHVKTVARSWKRKIKEGMLLSFSITLATMPVQLWFYYELPVYTVLINLLILPFVKPLLITGFAAMLLPVGGLSGKLPDGLSAFTQILPGSMAGETAYLILEWYEALCSFFDSLPFSVWNPGRPEVWQIVVYYCLLGVFVWKYGGTATKREREETKRSINGERIWQETGRIRREESSCWVSEKRMRLIKKSAAQREKLTMIGLLCAEILVIGVRPAAKNQVFFLNVGQGDCSIVRTASGQTFLIDCGSSSRSNVGRYVLLPFLKYYGIHTIDGVLLSHPDTDHVNGAQELLTLAEENRISIRQLVLPDVRETEREEALGELIQAAGEVYEDKGVPVRYISEGDSWQCEDAHFLCLHPSADCGGENANEYSMCIYIVFGEEQEPEMSVLFTGDVEGEGEKELTEALVRHGIHDITLLKTAHHGSRNSTSEELLEQLQPATAVISCGKNNRYGHPHEELIGRLYKAGVKVLRTDDLGAISVQEEGEHVKVTGYGRIEGMGK